MAPEIERLIKDDDLVGMRLREMAKTSRLTKEEEVELAKRIERGREAKRELENGRRHLSYSLRREYEQLVEDGEAARERFINANGLLIVSVVIKHFTRGKPIELDLVQEGELGLIEAVERFDWRRGHKFSTYATWWIRQTVGRAVKEKSRIIRVPSYMSDKIGRMLKTMKEFNQENGRMPTPEETSELMGTSVEKVNLMLRAGMHPISLDEPAGEDEEDQLGDFIKDERATDPYEEANTKLLRERINEVLSELSPREAKILRYRFGLADGESRTLEDLGRKFGITRERVRQIEAKALHRLRHPSRTRRLREFNE